MKQTFFFLVIIFVILLSCNQQKSVQPYFFQGNSLGTTYHIKAFPSGTSKNLQKKDIDSVIEAINNSLSTYRPNSLISRINKGEVLKTDLHFVEVYNTAEKIYFETDGLYDPTIGILVNAWGFGPKEKIKNIERDSSIVDSLKKFVNYKFLHLDKKGYLRKRYPQVYIDYNSIAKGYAIDRVGQMLADKGFKNYLVEIGGEVLAKGKNIAKDRAWLVAIDNPDRQHGNKFISYIALSNRAIATSGNYRKYYVDKTTGRKYVHTLNPKTGYPIQRHILSASVIAKNCTLADGYATAFMVMGYKAAEKFLQDHPELEAFLVYSDEKGQIKTFKTKGVKIVE